MTENVVEFPGKPIREGELAFAMCSCGSEAPMMPVVRVDFEHPVVVGLQCLDCEAGHDVVKGVIDLSGGE